MGFIKKHMHCTRMSAAKPKRVKNCVLCGNENIIVSLVHEKESSQHGKVMRKCPQYVPGHLIVFEDFQPDSLTVNDLKSILGEMGIAKTGNKAVLCERLSIRYENEFRSPSPTSSSASSSARHGSVKETPFSSSYEVESLGACFRAPVSGLRERCGAQDLYTDTPWRSHAKPQVDHIMEIQLCGYAWNTLPADSRRTRGQEADIRQLVNALGNLNVTSQQLNLAKGGRGGAFERAISDLRSDIFPGSGSLRTYMTRLQAETQRNISKAIVKTWESSLEPALREHPNATTSTAFADRLHEILFQVLKLEESAS